MSSAKAISDVMFRALVGVVAQMSRWLEEEQIITLLFVVITEPSEWLKWYDLPLVDSLFLHSIKLQDKCMSIKRVIWDLIRHPYTTILYGVPLYQPHLYGDPPVSG